MVSALGGNGVKESGRESRVGQPGRREEARTSETREGVFLGQVLKTVTILGLRLSGLCQKGQATPARDRCGGVGGSSLHLRRTKISGSEADLALTAELGTRIRGSRVIRKYSDF